MKLIDSAVAIDHLRGRPEAVELVRHIAGEEEWLGASELTRFEVLAGLRAGEEHDVEALFSELGWVPVEESIARRAGELARRYRASHAGIDDSDYLIAATALELGAELVTANVRHFPMLAGLEPAY